MKTYGIAVGTALASAAALTVAAPAVADTAPAGARPTSCRSGDLPPSVVGSPSVKAHEAKGVYLWHGKRGYALRVTEPTRARLVVRGTITVSGDIGNVRLVRTEKDDTVTVRGRTLTFRFVNHGGLDGLNFTAECSKTVQVAVRAGAGPLAPEAVFLGSQRQHPTSVPFTIERAHDGVAAGVH